MLHLRMHSKGYETMACQLCQGGLTHAPSQTCGRAPSAQERAGDRAGPNISPAAQTGTPDALSTSGDQAPHSPHRAHRPYMLNACTVSPTQGRPHAPLRRRTRVPCSVPRGMSIMPVTVIPTLPAALAIPARRSGTCWQQIMSQFLCHVIDAQGGCAASQTTYIGPGNVCAHYTTSMHDSLTHAVTTVPQKQCMYESMKSKPPCAEDCAFAPHRSLTAPCTALQTPFWRRPGTPVAPVVAPVPLPAAAAPAVPVAVPPLAPAVAIAIAVPAPAVAVAVAIPVPVTLLAGVSAALPRPEVTKSLHSK